MNIVKQQINEVIITSPFKLMNIQLVNVTYFCQIVAYFSVNVLYGVN